MEEVCVLVLRFRIGPYDLPLSKALVRSFRRGRAFWEILAEHSIPVTVMRMPTNYPPVNEGQALAGMGVPDLQGTVGTFTYYTDDPLQQAGDLSGGRILSVTVNGGRAPPPLEGPPNTSPPGRRPSKLDPLADTRP